LSITRLARSLVFWSGFGHFANDIVRGRRFGRSRDGSIRQPSLIYPILALVPIMGTAVAAALAMGAAFVAFGRGDLRKDLGCAALL
jgi:hypothetical protein